MNKSEVTVMVSGAAGQISYALLPRIVSGQMFGPEVKINLHPEIQSEILIKVISEENTK